MFTQEQLKAMGLNDDTISKILEQQKAEFEKYVLKTDYESLKSELNQEKDKVKDRDKTIKTLEGFKGTSEQLQQKINELAAEIAEKDKKYADNLKAEKKANAIKVAVMASEKQPHDVDMVIGLIDADKVVFGDDGKITGVNEQLELLQKEKAFMFKEAESKNKDEEGFNGKGFFFAGVTPKDSKKEKQSKETPESIGLFFAQNKLNMMGIKPKESGEK